MNGFKDKYKRLEACGDLDKITPNFSEGVIENGKLYAFDNKIRSPCVIDLSDMTMRICARCKLRIPVYVKRIFLFGNLILMQLYQGVRFLVFDREVREFVYYDAKQPDGGLYNIVPVGKEVFCIPLLWNKTILIFNMQFRSFEKINYNKSVINEGNVILRPFVKDREIIFPSQTDSTFYCLDVDGKTIEKRQFFKNTIVPYIASWDGKCLWCIEKHPKVLYCFDGNRIAGFAIPEGEYGNIVPLSEHICIMPGKESELLIIRKSEGRVTPISTAFFDRKSESENRIPVGSKYVYCAEDEERVFFFPNDRRKMFMLNKSDNSTETFLGFCDGYKRIWREIQLGDAGIIHENSEIGLKEFMDML